MHGASATFLSSKRATIFVPFIIGIFAALIRLAYLPFSTQTSMDRMQRVWDAWRWLDNPEIITHGLWGPLHNYLVALSMIIAFDPVRSPVLMQIVFEAFMPVLLYLFVKSEFRSSRAAILVALSYALYPLAILNTLGLMTQPLFSFFVLIALLFLSLARQEAGSAGHVLVAGISITLAAMIRYEGWMLIPFLAVTLYNKPKLAIIFAAFAMLHPTVWMIGNSIEYGDPFYSMNWAANWELYSMGRAELSLSYKIGLILPFLKKLLLWMTPPLAAASILGVALAMVKRDKGMVWLIPFCGLLFFYTVAIIRGSLVPKFEYTASLALFVFPYSAVAFTKLGIDKLSRRGAALATLGFGFSIFVFSYPPFVPHFLKLSVNPLPKFGGQEQVINLVIPALSQHLKNPEDGFISDFYGFSKTSYAALMIRIHPERVYMASGALDKDKAEMLAEVRDFIKRYPEGILLLHSDSRLAESLGYDDSEKFKVRVADKVVSMRKLWSTPWQQLSKEKLRGQQSLQKPELVILRYEVLGGA